MKIAIDATNIKAGGGLTHLKRLVESYKGQDFEIDLVGGEWLNCISNESKVKKIILKSVFNSLFEQEFFKLFNLKNYLKKSDIAFIPGGTFSSKKIRYVSMSQNMLVFDEKERDRYPISFTWLRLCVLKILQVKSFNNAEGIIYISEYSKSYIENKYPKLKFKKATVIFHGISDEFRQMTKQQKSIKEYSIYAPYKLLYVSIIDYYKHQWNVVEAVKRLRESGYSIELELIGPIQSSLKKKMEKVLKGTESFVKYRGKVPYEEIANSYKGADMFIFASTCENMPNILVEAMSAGLPILCSNYGPMPEILKDAGVYMDPTNVDSILNNLEKLLLDTNGRLEIAQKAYNYSLNYSWEKTANQTFEFIRKCI